MRALVERSFDHYVPVIGLRPAPMDADYAPPIERGEVWVTGEPIVGVLVLKAEPGHLFVDVVAVEPSRQGEGIGRRLMAFAERRGRERGVGEVRLLTNELMTENRAFYARLGYAQYERRVEQGFTRVYLRKPLGE